MAKALQTIQAGETLASMVYQRLLSDIVRGRLEPGKKLRLQELKEHYDVGNSPLREALNRLSANGMVVREENKGFRVSPATADELQELIRTRCWLEEVALRKSIKNGDEKWEEGIVVAYHRLSRVSRSSEEDPMDFDAGWEVHHRQYHLALLAACSSSILLGYCAQLHEQTLRYRNLGAMVAYRDRHESDEHLSIRDAVLERDADKAVALLNAHYQATAEVVIASGSLT